MGFACPQRASSQGCDCLCIPLFVVLNKGWNRGSVIDQSRHRVWLFDRVQWDSENTIYRVSGSGIGGVGWAGYLLGVAVLVRLVYQYRVCVF